MTTPNAELAYRTLDQIDAHPETWNQDTWWCGTGGRFAGWAVVLSGVAVHPESRGIPPTVVLEDDSMMELPDAALHLLGLTSDVAEQCDCGDETCGRGLFDGGNDRQDLGRFVEKIFGPRPDAVSA